MNPSAPQSLSMWPSSRWSVRSSRSRVPNVRTVYRNPVYVSCALPSRPVRSRPDAKRAGDVPSDRPLAAPCRRVDSPCTPLLNVKNLAGFINEVALTKWERCFVRMAFARSPCQGASPGLPGESDTTSRLPVLSNLAKWCPKEKCHQSFNRRVILSEFEPRLNSFVSSICVR